ncbi:MAG: hypothetical protein HZT40_16690 [Candidatus Thiothrix singaporensis]|uniref:Uncharacterized protein n=1 Tax=Candidatus Thiothrix singaporensis TaxID=2799669 RepID=A0A7L6AV42_9GAMM|nr:MAG: hypothetical protein HZT40_16690 [Candidatus Thiothrix singaporensis]
MKTNTPASPPHKGYFLSHIHEQAHGHSSMRLLALAFDLVLIFLLIMLAALLVLGQTGWCTMPYMLRRRFICWLPASSSCISQVSRPF